MQIGEKDKFSGKKINKEGKDKLCLHISRFPPEREGRRGHEIRELHHIRGRRNSSSPAKPRRGDSSGMDRPVKGYRSSESESSAETSALFTYSGSSLYRFRNRLVSEYEGDLGHSVTISESRQIWWRPSTAEARCARLMLPEARSWCGFERGRVEFSSRSPGFALRAA